MTETNHVIPASSDDGGPVRRAIFSRRSVRQFAPRPVERHLIEGLLEAAVQAPNHQITRPWRFAVLDGPGATRDAVAQIAVDTALAVVPDPTVPAVRAAAERKREEILQAPVIIFAHAVPGRDEMQTRENYAACACAVQNLMLAAVEAGLATGWSTGGTARHPGLVPLLGLEPDWQLVTMLYLGWPASDLNLPARKSSAVPYTRWSTDPGA